MAYLALARKWRPKAFSEVVGQQHVVQALSNALDSGRVHHAFLFTGTRGVGKTTLARIFAKSLNCEQGTSAEPCQQCGTCQSIDEGRFVDLIEVDAASRTKVDDTRELLENVQYAPTSGKFKVYLIDEVHMLSGHSFNALLKTLEEPPEHVKFLFATTDPQKLPVTVLSRCLQFNLRAMRPEQVENQMVKILGYEKVEFDSSAIQALAKASDGSMRDGLSLLDQAIAQGGGEVRANDVHGMLGTIKAEHTQDIIAALLSNDVDKALNVVGDMADSAVDFTVALDEVMMQLYYLSLAQVSPSSLSANELDSNKILELAKGVNPETLQLFYQIGLISKRDIALAPSLRVGFEMALLRMFAFEPADSQPSNVPLPETLSSLNEGNHGNVNSDVAEKKTVENTEKAKSSRDDADMNSDRMADYSELSQPKNNTESVLLSSSNVTQETHAASQAEQKAVQVESLRDPAPDFVAPQQKSRNDEQPAVSAESRRPPPWQEQKSDLSTSGIQPPEQSHSRSITENMNETESSAVAPTPTPDVEVGDRVSDTVDRFSNAGASDHAHSLIAVTLAGNNEWGELVEQTSLVGMAKELAMNCAADRMSDERIDLCLDPKLQHLYSDTRFEEIQNAIKSAVNEQISVQLDVDNSNRETPAECLTRLGYEHEDQVRDAMHNDPGVQSIMTEFKATIKENSIKPLSS